jgi:hypothetical protein
MLDGRHELLDIRPTRMRGGGAVSSALFSLVTVQTAAISAIRKFGTGDAGVGGQKLFVQLAAMEIWHP